MIEQMSEVTLVLLLSGIVIGAVGALIPSAGSGRTASGSKKWAIWGGVGFGFLASLVLTFVNTQWPKAVNRQNVALMTLPVAIALAIVIMVLMWKLRSPSISVDARDRLGRATRIVGFFYIAFVVFRSAPTAMAQAAMMFPNGFELLSTPMVMALSGYILGWIVVGVIAVISAKLYSLKQDRMWPLVITVLTLAVTHLLMVVRILQAKRIISLPSGLFDVLAWLINNEAIFPIVAMGTLGIVALVTVREARTLPRTGDNPAVKRLNVARVRVWKWMAGTAAFGYLCGALLVTIGVAVGSTQVELSEPEEYAVSATQDAAVINLEDVSDGHLHRYAYTTSSGVEVRFIVIQKAGASFGVALDACEICGPTGYYEKDGKIICKLCEVAMNIATIGFRGGCNPIPIDYEISNGTLTVPFSVLEAHAEIFA